MIQIQKQYLSVDVYHYLFQFSILLTWGGGLIVRSCQVECFGLAQHKLKMKLGKITLSFRSE